MILHDWKLVHGLVICAAYCATACCGKSTMMRAEQETTAGRAADVASRRTTEYQQQQLQAAAAVQASQAQVGAVRGEAEPGPVQGSGEGNTLYLECGDEGPGFVVIVEAQRARLFLPEGEVDLARMPVGSGAKYTDGKTVLWTQGDAAIFEDADGRRYMCSNNPSLAVWQDARRRGVSMRGVGEDWVLEVSPYSTVLVTDDGKNRFDMPTPEPDRDGAKSTYFGRDGDTTLRIVSEPKACRDPDTGENFGLRIEMDVGGRLLSGCGRDLDAGEL